MFKNANFIVVLIVLIVFLFAGILFGKRISIGLPVEYQASCAVTMAHVIEGGLGDVYDFEGVSDFEEPDIYYLVVYSVEGDVISYPEYKMAPDSVKSELKDFTLQNEAWGLFVELIPLSDREMVTQYQVFTDGIDNTLAAVEQSEDDPTQWILDVDIEDLGNKNALIFTVIHEFAHLLTLNASQVTPDADLVLDPFNPELQIEKAAACPNYFAGTGCSYPDSYIQAFHDRFWVDINDEWQKIDLMQYDKGDLISYYNALYGFYMEHRDQFVGDYAVTHPAEDIAESFTHFVFSPKPTGNSIREKKIRFFYDYPELVRLRGDILNGACSLDK